MTAFVSTEWNLPFPAAGWQVLQAGNHDGIILRQKKSIAGDLITFKKDETHNEKSHQWLFIPVQTSGETTYFWILNYHDVFDDGKNRVLAKKSWQLSIQAMPYEAHDTHALWFVTPTAAGKHYHVQCDYKNQAMTAKGHNLKVTPNDLDEKNKDQLIGIVPVAVEPKLNLPPPPPIPTTMNGTPAKPGDLDLERLVVKGWDSPVCQETDWHIAGATLIPFTNVSDPKYARKHEFRERIVESPYYVLMHKWRWELQFVEAHPGGFETVKTLNAYKGFKETTSTTTEKSLNVKIGAKHEFEWLAGKTELNFEINVGLKLTQNESVEREEHTTDEIKKTFKEKVRVAEWRVVNIYQVFRMTKAGKLEKKPLSEMAYVEASIKHADSFPGEDGL